MNWTTVNLVQGTQEWLEFRKNKFTASEAAAMLGLSSYKSRTKLLTEKKTGVIEQVDKYTQGMYDKGHAIEALARTILEQRFGDLYPETGYIGELSASLDGIDQIGQMIFEHKDININLVEAIKLKKLPDQYMAQVQQQLMLTKADYCIFVSSDGTEQNWHEIKIMPDQAWFHKIKQGWLQFKTDLENFEPVEEKPKAVGVEIVQLPTPGLVVTAEVVNSNLPVFINAAQLFINNIKTDLVTDQDFADAEQVVKFCKKAETELESAKSNALSQTETLAAALQTIDDIKEQLRAKRLIVEKAIKIEKESIKANMLAIAQSDWNVHLIGLEESLGIRVKDAPTPDFMGAIKGKKSLTNMQDAISTTLALSMIESKLEAQRIGQNIEHFKTATLNYGFLFNDYTQIIYMGFNNFAQLINTRIEQYQQAEQNRLAAERERIRAEVEQAEQAKLDARPVANDQDVAPQVTQKAQQAPKTLEPPQSITHKEISASKTPSGLKDWFDKQWNEGQIPLSKVDADSYIWPLIQEAYMCGAGLDYKAA